MPDNILKGTIKIEAPGVKEEFAKVEQGVANLQKSLASVPAAAKQSSDGLVSAFTNVTKIDIPPVKVDAEVGTINVPKIGIAPVQIPVIADTQTAKVALDNLGSSIKPLAIQLDTTEAQTKAKLLTSTIETLEAKLGARKEFIKVETDVTKIAKFNKEIQDLEKEIGRLKNIGKTGFDELGNKIDAYGNHLNTLSKRSAVATQSTINLGRVIQDAPYGFIGVANNLNPLLEGFQRLKAETGSASGAFKAFGSSMLGAGGIGIAISVVSALMVTFGDKLFSTSSKTSALKEKVDELKKKFDDLKSTSSFDILGSAGGEFSKAVAAIETLRENVDLAKKGFIEKKDVVNQYNKELGDTIGKVKTLDEVEKAIASKGAAYLQFTLLKAAAQQALSKASDAALIAAQKTAQSDVISDPLLKGVQNALKSVPGDEGQNLTAFNSRIDKFSKKFKTQADEANIQKDRFIDIFKQFQDQAAKLAKDNNFTFNPDLKTDTKGEKPKFDFLFDFLPFNPSGKLKPEEKSKLLDASSKFQKEFQGIFKGVTDLVIGTDQQRIAKAIQFDLKLKAGKVQFDLTRIREATDKAIKDADIIPESTIGEIDATIVDKFIRGFQNAQETLKSKNLFGDLSFLSTDLTAAIDLFKTRVTQIGGQIPKAVEGINIQGKAVRLKFDDLFDTSKISNADALDALKKAFDKIKGDVKAQTIDLADSINGAINNALASIEVEGLSTIGEAIGAAIGGGNIGNVFQQFAQNLGSAVQGLGKQIIALNIAALAAKKSLSLTFANPAVGIAAGIALVAVGAALKNLIGGGIKGFNKGGDVPGVGSSDTVPAMLTPGEYIVTKDKAPLAKALLAAFGKGPSVKGFQFGGDVRFVPKISMPSLPSTNITRYNHNVYSEMGKGSVDVNVYGEFKQHGDHLVAVINKTNRNQKIAY